MDNAQNQLGRELLGGLSYTGLKSMRGEMGWSTFEERKAKYKIKYYGRRKFTDESRRCKLIEKATGVGEFGSGWFRLVQAHPISG